jgi:hypothetical protein
MIIEMNSLIERDIDELSKAMTTDYKVKCKAIYQNRMAEMIANGQPTPSGPMQYMQCNLQGLYKWWCAPVRFLTGLRVRVTTIWLRLEKMLLI